MVDTHVFSTGIERRAARHAVKRSGRISAEKKRVDADGVWVRIWLSEGDPAYRFTLVTAGKIFCTKFVRIPNVAACTILLWQSCGHLQQFFSTICLNFGAHNPNQSVLREYFCVLCA